VLTPYATGQVVVEQKGTYKSFTPAALAATTAWKARDKVTKSAVAITSVTANATIKGFTFVVAPTPNTVEVQTVNPAALAVLNIGSATAGGFESDGWCSLGE
jgi:expansin (peptidoglycan-binding protein)